MHRALNQEATRAWFEWIALPAEVFSVSSYKGNNKHGKMRNGLADTDSKWSK
jgi:hypothetical protein